MIFDFKRQLEEQYQQGSHRGEIPVMPDAKSGLDVIFSLHNAKEHLSVPAFAVENAMR